MPPELRFVIVKQKKRPPDWGESFSSHGSTQISRNDPAISCSR